MMQVGLLFWAEFFYKRLELRCGIIKKLLEQNARILVDIARELVIILFGVDLDYAEALYTIKMIMIIDFSSESDYY